MNWNIRSSQLEWIDEGNLSFPELKKNLNEISRLNHFLGSEERWISDISEKVLHLLTRSDEVWLIDMGCGSGHLIRKLHKHLALQKDRVQFYGVDNNPQMIDLAQSEFQRPNVHWIQQDALEYIQKLSQPKEVQVVLLASLFFHHLPDREISKVLLHVNAQKWALFVSDLQRSQLAYTLFFILSNVLFLSRVSRHDGLISITRGFTRKNWLRFKEENAIHKLSISSQWAFRHQITILP